MRVLVTGANGFVGRAVVMAGHRAGWSVRAGVRDLKHADMIDGADEHASLDLERPHGSSALRGIDVVIHLAARVHVMHDRAADPLSAFRDVNVAGTERLAQAAVRAGVRRFVFISSAKVHGGEREQPYRESDAPAPVDAYGVSKHEAELALERIAAGSELETTILRPPLVYGPGVRANFLALLRAVDSGVPLPLGNIRNRRSMVYLGNLADAISRCAVDPRARQRTYLVSDGVDLSTPELAARIACALKRPVRMWALPHWAMGLATRLPLIGPAARRVAQSLAVDASRIRAELDWAPPFSITAGLTMTAEWYRSRARPSTSSHASE